MEKKLTLWERLFGPNEDKAPDEPQVLLVEENKKPEFPTELLEEIAIKALKQVLPPNLPVGASSESSTGYNSALNLLKQNINYVTPEFNRDQIPFLRRLSFVNPDISQAVDTLVKLGNTGFKIRFDPKVKPDMVDKMRTHINNRLTELTQDYGGISSFMNRLYRQIYIAGAISGEWVPQNNLRGFKKIILVRPEHIYWVYDKEKREWFPYQRTQNPTLDYITEGNLILLNKKTYRYHGLMGDDDLPYGIPPLLAAIEPLEVQKDMLTNIKTIVKQLGIIGFMQALLDKEDKKPDESDSAYKGRMEGLLQETAKRLSRGLKDGISVGFKDDIEFEFHTPTKATSGGAELFIQNELLLMSGMKIDSTMLGRPYATSEGHITVVFNKLLSELKNVQNCVKEFLEYGFKLELVMAGFSFETLEVQFNASTLNDDLKYQQAREIRIRNSIAMYNQGIWDNNQVADELGEEKPNRLEPRVMTDPAAAAQKSKKREDGKDASDRSNRKKNRPGEKSQKDKGTKNN
jgi:hypothetical protein